MVPKNKVVIAPYRKSKCRGARNLAMYGNYRCHGVLYMPRAKSAGLVINWGSTKMPAVEGIPKVLNDPISVCKAANKIRSLEALRRGGVPTVASTTWASVAVEWLQQGQKVVQRKLIKSSSGRGITVLSSPSEVDTSAKLWTVAFSKTHEYRVHIGRIYDRLAVIDFQSKRNKHTNREEDLAMYVWNLDTGYKYYHSVKIPDSWKVEVTIAAKGAIRSLDLDFGAVDVGFNADTGKCAVFEVNTAPGLTRTKSFEAYCNWIEQARQKIIPPSGFMGWAWGGADENTSG